MSKQPTEVAVFGGGCFWCTEAVFKMLRGVTSVASGYAGGTTENPTYKEICGGKTGHAEVIKIEYDPDNIPFADLLTVFFATHDPTTKNRQGDDVGEQYRSAIFFTTPEQKTAAERFIANLNASSREGKPITTEVRPLDAFYPAEDYHQDFYRKNPGKSYCAVVINPKLEKVRREFARLLSL